MKRRSTPTKDAVLNIIKKTGKAMSQDAIEDKIDIEINRATIYRILNRFCEDGVLHKVVAEDGKQYFAPGLDSNKYEEIVNHLHFKCTKCETIECLPFEAKYSIPNGYTVENVSCILTGVCKACS